LCPSIQSKTSTSDTAQSPGTNKHNNTSPPPPSPPYTSTPSPPPSPPSNSKACKQKLSSASPTPSKSPPVLSPNSVAQASTSPPPLLELEYGVALDGVSCLYEHGD
ncbi:hypothetical protein D6C90_08580, partial [Aureobasidium pullulans]